MQHHTRILAAASLFVALVHTVAVGQSDRREDVHLRNDCRLAAQVLRTGQPATKTSWAWAVISLCANDGPPVLAELWASVSSDDSARAETVLNASSRLRDQRIADAARRVAMNPANTDAVRLSGIILLIRYADPHSGLAVPLLVAPDGWTPGRRVRMISGGWGPHKIPQTEGEVPLGADFGNSVVSLLRAIAGGDSSHRIQYVATGLASRLEWDIEHGYIH
jgi:hypothetical protein